MKHFIGIKISVGGSIANSFRDVTTPRVYTLSGELLTHKETGQQKIEKRDRVVYIVSFVCVCLWGGLWKRGQVDDWESIRGVPFSRSLISVHR